MALSEDKLIEILKENGFLVGTYNAGDGTGRKIPYAGFESEGMMAALTGVANAAFELGCAEGIDEYNRTRDKMFDL